MTVIHVSKTLEFRGLEYCATTGMYHSHELVEVLGGEDGQDLAGADLPTLERLVGAEDHHAGGGLPLLGLWGQGRAVPVKAAPG